MTRRGSCLGESNG